VAVQAVAQRRWERLHEKAPWHDGRFRIWAAEYSPITPYYRDDGVTIWVSREDLSPDDDFLAERPSVAEQSPGEQDETAD
jgi:hypothetical protein